MSKSPSDIFEKQVALAVILALLAISSAYGIYFGLVLRSNFGSPDSWGQFGDYVGGLVNPIIGIATVLLIIKTLNVTREESRRSRAEMQLQLEHFQKQEILGDLRKRLEGTLAAWNTAMDVIAPVFLRGSLESKRAVMDASQLPFRYYLYHSYIINEMTNVASGNDFADARNWWNRNLELFLHLLDEFHLYCADYESRVGNVELTDFYRRRIQQPLRAFKAIGIADKEVLANLSIGLRFKDFV